MDLVRLILDLGTTWCLGRPLADIREMVWDI